MNGYGIEICVCAHPIPQVIVTNGGDKIAVQCGRCLNAHLQKCDNCGEWIKDPDEHRKEAHPKIKKPVK